MDIQGYLIGEYEPLGERFQVMSAWSALLAVTDEPYILTMKAEHNRDTDAWDVKELTLSEWSIGGPITSEGLREVGVSISVFRVVKRMPGLVVDLDGNDFRAIQDGLREELTLARSDGPTAGNLSAAADLYRASRLIGETPIALIQDMFGVPHRTASHWVKLARERGHLASLPERASNG